MPLFKRRMTERFPTAECGRTMSLVSNATVEGAAIQAAITAQLPRCPRLLTCDVMTRSIHVGEDDADPVRRMAGNSWGDAVG